MSDAFSDRARVQAMLDVEAALAEAEASLEIIPTSAARAIRAAAVVELYDLALIRAEAHRAGNAAIPLVAQLTTHVARSDAAAARYVHWGVTSQDIIDTAFAVQIRASVPPIVAEIQRAASAAAQHARRHVDTIMPGRTWLQQATPTTFGLKAAGWMDALTRVHVGLARALDGALVLQFGGASGTLAAFGTRGPDVAAELGERLKLHVPTLPWHAHRDRIAELACALGLAAGTLGKTARDLALLAQTEVGEAYEPATEAGGSSTMPHKRNPVRAAVSASAAIRAPGLVATVLSAMPQEHERGLGGWQTEWDAMPALIVLTAESAEAIADALQRLVVDPDRMQANLALTRGLVMAEAVVMRLAPHLGKAEAHALVEAACRRASLEKRHLQDVLAEEPAVTAVIDRGALSRALAPDQYLGAARTFVEHALNQHEARARGDE
jgi:3-carboxy-cis,cis-muconate cycloisomerase